MSLLPDLSQSERRSYAATSSLEFLRSIYSDPNEPIHRRLRAAIAALPFEHPKLAVTATIGADGGFAERLEAAIARSGKALDCKPRIISIDEKQAS